MTEVASAAPAVAMPLVVEEEIRDTPATATATPSVVDVLKAAAAKEEAQRLEELQERVRPSEDAVPAAADADDVEEPMSDGKVVDPDVVVCSIPFSFLHSLFLCCFWRVVY